MRKCEDSPPGQVLLAIRQFNSALWFECHETLEALWINEEGAVRDFFQGIIQIAIGLHHWRNNNNGGAIKLLTSGVSYLVKTESVCMWVDTLRLITDTNRMCEAIIKHEESETICQPELFVPMIHTVSSL